MSAEVASSALAIPLSRIRELAEVAMTMDGVYKLYFGESNLPTPDFIKQSAARALNDGFTYYTENAGTPSLRREIAAYYGRMHNVDIDPTKRLVITASGLQALHLGIRCVLDPGDEAIVLTPAWPNGSAIVQMCNARVHQIAQPVRDGRYTVDFEALERAITPRTRLLLYTSPSNPLGWVVTRDEQQRLLDFARRHSLWLMADEVYERLDYGSSCSPSILQLAHDDDAVLVVQSFSKSYCMTGWRLGWLLARKDLIARAAPLNEFFVSHATTFVQKAGETALRDGEEFIAWQQQQLRSNRDYANSVLRSLPRVTVPEPEGAFYLFPKIEGLTDSFAFCKDVLLQTKVGLAPGVAFGAGGEGSIRLCYAAERSILEPALDRFASYMRQDRAIAQAR